MKYELQNNKRKLFKGKPHPLIITGIVFILGAVVLKLLADSQSRVDY